MPQMEISNSGIAVIDGVFSKTYCDKLISYFLWSQQNNRTWERVGSLEIDKKDEACGLVPTEILFGTDNNPLISEFNRIFFDECYPAYVHKFSVLNEVGRHAIYSYKIQQTRPSEGYHTWHCEADNAERCRRIGTYILYLNDVPEGGETEFLYLSQRIQPKTGRLVIFPAGYVYAHRGNPPLGGTKYIMTGWLEFM